MPYVQEAVTAVILIACLNVAVVTMLLTLAFIAFLKRLKNGH
jgi:hypothetical protein